MKSATKLNEVSQVNMAQENANYWLRLLGDQTQVNRPADFGHNGHSVELQALATQPEMLNYKSDFWLRLLSGTAQADYSTNNGSVAKMTPEALGNQQFAPENWLRLLGASR